MYHKAGGAGGIGGGLAYTGFQSVQWAVAAFVLIGVGVLAMCLAQRGWQRGSKLWKH